MKYKCNCKHEFQDSEHGKSVRIVNPTAKIYPDGTREFRCTVCNQIHKIKKDEK